MRDARKNQLLNILQQRVERLALRGRIGGKGSANLSGLYLRENGKRFNPRLIVGNPVDDGVAVAAEFVRRHVKRFFGSHCCQGFQDNFSLKDQKTYEPAMLLLPGPAEIQSRLVFESNSVVNGSFVEDAAQLAQHGRMLRMLRPGGIRR
jgi:hypothetical protein